MLERDLTEQIIGAVIDNSGTTALVYKGERVGDALRLNTSLGVP